METIGMILVAIVQKTDSNFLLFCIVVAVTAIAIAVPLGIYCLKRVLDSSNNI